ncbi:MAG: sulfatase-like hydrolase/transferase, partial [Phycisphaeraceae bacterium]|nr:sulfatase-like hydrolase/transferase [Phycisphaeraceae bacterium]
MSQDRPNVLLITSDQQHFTTLGFLNPKIETPNLDRLAAEGTNFSRAYTNNPVCSPSRGTMITGQYPSSHGCWTIGVKLPEDQPFLGDHFRAAGYDASLIGKAHFQPLASDPDGPGGESLECQPILRDLDFWSRFNDEHTPWYGFNHVELARNHADEAHVGQHYALWMEEQGLDDWRDYFQPPPGRDESRNYREPDNPRSWQLPAEYHYTTWTGQRTAARIKKCVAQDKPFFCWSSFHDPHPPYLVPEPWASMYDPADMEPGELVDGELDDMPEHFRLTQEENPDFSAWREPGGSAIHGFRRQIVDRETLQKDMACYYGMVSFMDHEIGRILDTLDEQGVADNTLIVFTTDHGHFLGQHGLTAKGPFHYEDLLRLPFLVRWPDRVPAGTTSDALQGLVDLAP